MMTKAVMAAVDERVVSMCVTLLRGLCVAV
jgi:hypothetical protein